MTPQVNSRPEEPAPPAGPHPLLRYFLDAADGRFPPADGGVTVLGPLPRGAQAVRAARAACPGSSSAAASTAIRASGSRVNCVRT